jgi:hypothetical protein
MGINDWNGYLIKSVATGVIFRNSYIEWGTWKSTPNQREELKAYRDDNTRTLTRVTASGMKSLFSFSLRPGLRLADKIFVQNFFTQGEITDLDKQQRRIQLEFWDDENNVYKTGYFYRPNMEFKILGVTNTDIIYDSLSIECIEY